MSQHNGALGGGLLSTGVIRISSTSEENVKLPRSIAQNGYLLYDIDTSVAMLCSGQTLIIAVSEEIENMIY